MNAPTLSHRVDRAEQALQNCVEQIEKQGFTVALVGEAGSGKSSLINRITGEYVAPIGATETTMDATTYAVPNSALRLVDLPGYGTQTWPTARFIDDVHLAKYNAVLLIYSARVKSDDILLFQALKDKNIPVVVVRNSIDIALEGEASRGDKNARSYTQVLEDIIEDARLQFRARDLDIFAVSAHPERPRYELDRLIAELQQAARAHAEARLHACLHNVTQSLDDASLWERARFYTKLAARTMTLRVVAETLRVGQVVATYALRGAKPPR